MMENNSASGVSLQTAANEGDTWYPKPVSISQNSQITPIEDKIIDAFCRYYNPFIYNSANPRPPASLVIISEMAKLSYEAVRQHIPHIVAKLPQYFSKSNKKKSFGGFQEYIFTFTPRLNIKASTKAYFADEPALGDTNYTETELEKALIFQHLVKPQYWKQFEKTHLPDLMLYDIKEVKLRGGFLAKQMKRKKTYLHVNYIVQCFTEQWRFTELNNLSKKEKDELSKSCVPEINAILDQISDKYSRKEKAA